MCQHQLTAISKLLILLNSTVEPRSTDTRLIRTTRYYGQFCLSQRKAHIFSLKLTCLLRTLVNTGNGHFSVPRVTKSYTSPTLLYGCCNYLCTVHCHCYARLQANLRKSERQVTERSYDKLEDVTEYLTSENLVEMENNISNVLSNIQST